MYTRVQDEEDHINEELLNYGTQRSSMEDFLMKLHNDQYLKIDASGKTPNELCASAQWLVQKDASVPLKPAPKELRDMGDLLNDPIPLPNGDDPPEGTLPRTYSLW